MLTLLRSRLCATPLCLSPLRLSSRDYSTITSANGVPLPSTTSQKGCNLIADFLINSLGFSRDEAVSVSSKVSPLKSTSNPQLIINLFQQVGLDQTQIKDIVFSAPRILRQRSEETLEPKIRELRDLGLSGSDLVRLIKKKGGKGLDRGTISKVGYLRQVLGGSDDKVAKVINGGGWLLWYNAPRTLPPLIALFRNYSFSNDQIEKLIVRHPKICMRKLEWIQDVLHRVEGELGIPRKKTRAFFYGFIVLCGNSKTTLDKKFGVFRSFGWSDADIVALVGSNPCLLSYSESAIRQKLEFYIQELEYTPAYLASYNAFFTLSLEKRVKPRNEVLKILKEHKLIKSELPLCSILCHTEDKFVKLFVLPYTDEVPNLYETYMKNHQQLEA